VQVLNNVILVVQEQLCTMPFYQQKIQHATLLCALDA
jgi:hypothetical protein